MDEDDDVSIVVGRLLTDVKFDLVVAGYRHPGFLKGGADVRTITLVDHLPGSVLDRMNHEPHLAVPEIRYEGIPDAEILSKAITDSFLHFKRAVENQGIWRNLYDQPGWRPAHESRHQSLFRVLAGLTVEALGIRIFPGTDHGTGPADLTFVLGDAIEVIEFKKDYDIQRLVHGISVQLPTYMESANTRHGGYFVMCHERDPGEVIEIIARVAADMHPSRELIISVQTVDYRRQESASKRIK